MVYFLSLLFCSYRNNILLKWILLPLEAQVKFTSQFSNWVPFPFSYHIFSSDLISNISVLAQDKHIMSAGPFLMVTQTLRQKTKSKCIPLRSPINKSREILFSSLIRRWTPLTEEWKMISCVILFPGYIYIYI